MPRRPAPGGRSTPTDRHGHRGCPAARHRSTGRSRRPAGPSFPCTGSTPTLLATDGTTTVSDPPLSDPPAPPARTTAGNGAVAPAPLGNREPPADEQAAAGYPAHWEADVLAADGGILHLRPVRPDDAQRLVALHSRLSDRTRYLRYFGAYPKIPPRDLDRFVHVDHSDRVALAAELGGEFIAIGRYERIDTGADAEVAFVVEDAHQGRGVGSVLLEHLAAAARERGIRRFVAEVLAENSRMVRVFLDAGYSATR